MTRSIRIPPTGLDGDLTIPDGASGVVLFAHGSGSSRLSSRNRHVAEVLNRGGLATLLMDLLTEREEAEDARTAQLRFDIPLLARRLEDAIAWLSFGPATSHLRLGLFGASTGAAAALAAAARRPRDVVAIVSRGGRPDLAGEALGSVEAPALFIVGGRDDVVLELNQQAAARMRRPPRLEVVPGASHLFEEPGALERVGGLALDWFVQHLTAKRGSI